VRRIAGQTSLFSDLNVDTTFPLVSIAMPVYNCERTIAQAIRSILAQSFTDWELLIVNDGSTDDTISVIQQFPDPRIRVWSDHKNLGLPTRLNETIEQSRGDYYARMDGDDIAYPERLEKQVRYLGQHPQVDLVGAGVIVFRQGGIPIGKQDAPECHDDICKKPLARFPIAHPTYVGKMEWFKHYLYDDVPNGEDQDLLVRSYRFSHFANVPEILLGYRQEEIDLRKTLIARRHLALSLFREFRRQGRPGLAFRAFAEQGLKAVADSVAAGTGLNYRLLRHRARPISQPQRQQWEQVWKMANHCGEGTGSAHSNMR
jgi:glycosyltransferase involved in cell wall biosynthesis